MTAENNKTRHAQSLGTGYRPIEGVSDEMMDATGALRPAWQRFISALGTMSPQDMDARAARAERYLNDAGVYYRFYSAAGTQDRDWPLAHLPVLIGESEWATLRDGLVQRADLLERIVADVYGPNDLARQRLLPPALIAGNREFLRPLSGTRPASGHFLHLIAFELGRGPDGRWWVLSDRTQAPSGLGFALENRVATVKAFADIHGDMNVHRLAGFFRQFRDHLSALAGPDGSTGIFTPGALNETYYEQAYIARYLGLSLLEGEDLTVVDGRVMIRTVSGLKPVNVLWRRLDGAFADPLELNQDSAIGTPGLVQALRRQTVHVLNAVGAGIVEMRALLAFLPKISEALDGEALKLPSIATWWCGQQSECAHVMDNLDRMMIGPALSPRLPFEDKGLTVHGAALSDKEKAAWHDRLTSSGGDYVAQEAVSLSTTPLYTDGKFTPRPMTLRVYLARTPEGWCLMNGGFARIGETNEANAIAMQQGGRAADVWIVSDEPVPQETLMPVEEGPFQRRLPGTLPARAAENLTWLGRYIERTESTARLLRAFHARLEEESDGSAPLISLVEEHLTSRGIDAGVPVPAMLVDTMDRAIAAAGNVRSRFSPDGWLALRDLAKTLGQLSETVEPGDDAARAMTVILRKLAGLNGLIHENMYRFTGWRFLEIGRRLERAGQLAGNLALLSGSDTPEGAWDMMLEIADSTLTHRRQYTARFGRLTMLDIVALDPANPRSLIFQLERLKEEIARLPRGADADMRHRLDTSILKLHTDLAVTNPAALDADGLNDCDSAIARLYDTLAETFF